MKKCFFLLVCVALTGTSKLFSQAVVNEGHMAKSVCAVTVHPLILVDGFETDMESLSIDPNNIDRINILKNGSAVDKYGDRAKEGAIVITLKAGTQLYTISDFVDPSKDLNKKVKKVQLNGKLLIDINKLLIDKTAQIKSTIAADEKSVSNCALDAEETLVINTTLPDKK
jgi:hypothetical protein